MFFLLHFRLSDGGLLVSHDGNSYTTYMKEEVDGYESISSLLLANLLLVCSYPNSNKCVLFLSSRYRIVIGGKTCMFRKENDPTVLR